MFRRPVDSMLAASCRAMLIVSLCVALWGLYVLAVRLPGLAVVVALLAYWMRRNSGAASDAYGSARTASITEMMWGGLLADDGLILGRCMGGGSTSLLAAVLGLLNPAMRADAACRLAFASLFGIGLKDRLIRITSYVHLLTCSPAGGGKGVGAVIPNLLSYRGSVVVVDPKGELYRETAKHRRKVLKHKIRRYDPFNLCGPGGDTVNPYDFPRPESPEFIDDVQTMANAMIVRAAEEKEPHWNDNAELFIKGFSAFICTCEPDPAERNLDTMRKLSSSMPKLQATLEAMQGRDDLDGLIARLGGQMAQHEGEERASILSTFHRQTAFLDSPLMARHFQSSSFDPIELRRRPTTLYLILPANRLESHSRVLRLWINTVMGRITGGKPTERNPVLWIFDEMAHIGRIPAVENAVTLMRGAGMRCWFIFQSLEQFKTTFGEKAATVLDNIGTQQFFGITSYETCDTLSKRIGDETRAVRTVSTQDGYSQSHGGQPQGSTSGGTTVNMQEVSRKLLMPNELLQLPKEVCLIFHSNLPVVLGKLVRFYEAPEFAKRWNGRRGAAEPRGFGLVECGLAAATLAACFFLPLFVFNLFTPGRAARPAGARQVSAAAAPSPASAKRPISKLVPTPEKLRPSTSRNRRGTATSDYLIRID